MFRFIIRNLSASAIQHIWLISRNWLHCFRKRPKCPLVRTSTLNRDNIRNTNSYSPQEMNSDVDEIFAESLFPSEQDESIWNTSHMISLSHPLFLGIPCGRMLYIYSERCSKYSNHDLNLIYFYVSRVSSFWFNWKINEKWRGFPGLNKHLRQWLITWSGTDAE